MRFLRGPAPLGHAGGCVARAALATGGWVVSSCPAIRSSGAAVWRLRTIPDLAAMGSPVWRRIPVLHGAATALRWGRAERGAQSEQLAQSVVEGAR
jgi:hypothetical protein